MMREFMTAAAALGDESRIRILLALGEAGPGELCVCQITELLGLAPSTVSKHLSLLKQAQLVDARKNGRWMFYRLADSTGPEFARDALAWVRTHAGGEPQALADRARLAAILKEDPEEICRRQLNGGSRSCSCAPATPAAARWPKAGPGRSRGTSSRRVRRASNRTG